MNIPRPLKNSNFVSASPEGAWQSQEGMYFTGSCRSRRS